MLPHETHCVALSRTFGIWTKKVWTTPPSRIRNNSYKAHWIFWMAPQLAQV